MKSATVNEIKKELQSLAPEQVLQLCMRLAKYKKDNKELFSYLLFEAHNEAQYIEQIKQDVDEWFDEINVGHSYYIKKTLRKILRHINKQVKYSGIKQTEVELLLYFCGKCRDKNIPLAESTALYNLYVSQIKKIVKALASLHEDLQYDYLKELDGLRLDFIE
jgi:hypothetical protein